MQSAGLQQYGMCRKVKEKERTTKLITGSATEKAEGEQDENFIDPARRPGL